MTSRVFLLWTLRPLFSCIDLRETSPLIILMALHESLEGQAISRTYFEEQRLSLIAHFERTSKGGLVPAEKVAAAFNVLPHVRIKRVMKQDACEPHPRKVAADAVHLMSYATQAMVGEITGLAFKLMTRKEGRRTLQLRDVLAAVNSSRKFDFLCDVVDEFMGKILCDGAPPKVHPVSYADGNQAPVMHIPRHALGGCPPPPYSQHPFPLQSGLLVSQRARVPSDYTHGISCDHQTGTTESQEEERSCFSQVTEEEISQSLAMSYASLDYILGSLSESDSLLI